MADLPTLSHLRGYNTDHLAAAALHWTDAAGRWRNTYITVEQETHLLDWEGAARETAVDRVARDHAIVKANAGALETAAGIARDAASSLLTAARAVTHLADEATENGYLVAEDFDVDFPPTTNITDYKAKFIQAEQYSADLRFRAGNFMAHEHQTASDLIQAVDDKVCDDPDYVPGILRRLGIAVAGGAMWGGLVGGVSTGGAGAGPGAIVGGAGAGILDILHEVTGDGPKCT